MIGILVHGDNHFIVAGPLPSPRRARSLAREWEVPNIGRPPETGEWRIVTRAFREDLAWAVVLEGDQPIQPAISTLLDELRSRSVPIHRQHDDWHGAD